MRVLSTDEIRHCIELLVYSKNHECYMRDDGKLYGGNEINDISEEAMLWVNGTLGCIHGGEIYVIELPYTSDDVEIEVDTLMHELISDGCTVYDVLLFIEAI